MKKNNKYTSVDDALLKLQAYCSYQDRCHSEVRTKLISLNIYGDDLEKIIYELIADKYLDEERFARSYARGKFRIKNWGRYKIQQALKQKQVSAYCIKKAMTEIEEEDYITTLYNIIAKKTNMSSFEKISYKEKQKIIKWAMGKGYEFPLIQKVLDLND